MAAWRQWRKWNCDVRASEWKAASSQGGRQMLTVVDDDFEAKFEEGR